MLICSFMKTGFILSCIYSQFWEGAYCKNTSVHKKDVPSRNLPSGRYEDIHCVAYHCLGTSFLFVYVYVFKRVCDPSELKFISLIKPGVSPTKYVFLHLPVYFYSTWLNAFHVASLPLCLFNLKYCSGQKFILY